MNTLVINGSPHPNGESMTIFNEMREHLNGNIDIIMTYGNKISPCIDCRHCWEHDECAIKDGMQAIYDNIDSYDNVIIVSPLHFSELSSMLLKVASRLQVYWCAEFFRKKELIHKPKKGVLIVTGGGNTGTSKPISTAKMIFKHLNAEMIGSIFSMNTNELHTKEDMEALGKARELAHKLNSLYESMN